MKTFIILFALLASAVAEAQNITPVKGAVYGTKPNTVGMMPASKLEAYMDVRARVSTTIEGKVLKVTKTKGGWFNIDAGNGKIIAAHFKVYNINIPASLAGHIVIIEGVAQKRFIADDMQHLAGDTASSKKEHAVKTNPKQRLDFEVTGLEVE
jgi:hypothetical protein